MKVDESKLKVPEGWSNEPKDLANLTSAFLNFFSPREDVRIDKLLPVLASKDQTTYLLKGMLEGKHVLYLQWDILSEGAVFCNERKPPLHYLKEIFPELSNKKLLAKL